MDDSPVEFALSSWSRRLWLELAPRLDARAAFVRCGALWVAADEEEYELASARLRAPVRQRVASAMLDAQELRGAEPALRGGILVPTPCSRHRPSQHGCSRSR